MSMKRITTLALTITLALMAPTVQAYCINDGLDTTEDEATNHENTFTFDSNTFGISENAFKVDDEQICRSLAVTNTKKMDVLQADYLPELSHYSLPLTDTHGKYSLSWMHTNEGVKPYKFLDDMSFVGIPLFVAGIAIKGDKAMFKVNDKEGSKNTQLLTDFKTRIDDYTQFFGPAMTVGLKLGGVEGRSDWGRLLASAGMSYGIMALFVNGIKYTAKEMRPDGSTANSWPSGHTATSFVGATLLHKEYGLTRSPWYSVAGFGVATATGVMRVLNNRHWVSDVMSGAGIGIISTELGYALGDILFKGRGLLRNDLITTSESPSFFAISMGMGLGGKSLTFDAKDIVNYDIYDPKWVNDEEMGGLENGIQFRAATVVDAEGAYFFNNYVGVGGRLRVRAMSAKSFEKYTELASKKPMEGWTELIGEIYHKDDFFYESFFEGAPVMTNIEGIVKSDHLAEFSGSLGLYFNLPLSNRLSLGTKLLIGRSFTQELEIDGHVEGTVRDIDYYFTINNGEIEPGGAISYPTATNEKYDSNWTYLTVGAKDATIWGTGLSLTYRYKSNFSWRLFADYDYSKKDFTMTYDPYAYLQDGLTTKAYDMLYFLSPHTEMLNPIVYRKAKKMNYFTLGLSFMVNI